MTHKIYIVVIIVFSFCIKEVTSQSQIWLEDFPYPDSTTQGSGTPPKWTTTAPSFSDYFEVRSNHMEGLDLDGEAVWTSQSIDISGYVNIQISLDISQFGNMNDNEYLNIYYLLNGGPTKFIVGEYSGNFGSKKAFVNNLFGSSLVIVVKVKNYDNSHYHTFDNVMVQGSIFSGPDNPTDFNAITVNESRIDLSLTPNITGDDVIIVWNNTGIFSNPSGTPPSIGQTLGGGTVLYQGDLSLFSHTNLTSCLYYCYAAWSFDGNNYSSGVLTDEFLRNEIDLPWFEDFESIGPTTTFLSNESVINGSCGWSYEKTVAGKLSFDSYAYNGTKAAAMDATDFLISVNYLIATLNLSNYSNSTKLELSFFHVNFYDDYHSNDRVWIRGSDTDPWLEIYNLFANQGESGIWVPATELDIDSVISDAGQTITSTFQLRFGQEDNNALGNEGRGIDDILIESKNPFSNISTKVFLEGPYNGTDMNTNLNALLPLDQPFNGIPWNYPGSESVNSIPNIDVVDWVLLDLRDALTPDEATSETSINKQACFLLKDGSIVDLDGVSDPIIPSEINYGLFPVIFSRNHLSIISNNAVPASELHFEIDFSTGPDKVFGGSNGYKEIKTGVWGMIGGNSDGDGIIDLDDKSFFWKYQSGTKGFHNSDFDFDAEINNVDKNELWVPNLGKTSQVPN